MEMSFIIYTQVCPNNNNKLCKYPSQLISWTSFKIFLLTDRHRQTDGQTDKRTKQNYEVKIFWSICLMGVKWIRLLRDLQFSIKIESRQNLLQIFECKNNLWKKLKITKNVKVYNIFSVASFYNKIIKYEIKRLTETFKFLHKNGKLTKSFANLWVQK